MSRYQLDEEYLHQGGLQVEQSARTIARTVELADGSMTRDFITTKRTWRFTYEDLPGQEEYIPSGDLGRDSIRALYDAGGTCTLTVPNEVGESDEVTVMFSEEWIERRKRVNPFWRWDFTFVLIEV